MPVDAAGSVSARYTHDKGGGRTGEPSSPRQRKSAAPLPPLQQMGDVPRPRRTPLTSEHSARLHEVLRSTPPTGLQRPSGVAALWPPLACAARTTKYHRVSHPPFPIHQSSRWAVHTTDGHRAERSGATHGPPTARQHAAAPTAKGHRDAPHAEPQSREAQLPAQGPLSVVRTGAPPPPPPPHCCRHHIAAAATLLPPPRFEHSKLPRI